VKEEEGMRKLMMLAPVMALALVSANCSGGAFNSPTGPGLDVSDSATEARGGGGGGGKKGGGGTGGTTTGGGSLALVMVNDAYGDGGPNCYQGSSWVYTGSHGYYPDYPWANDFLLSSNSWLSGAAECTATLYTSFDGSSTTTLATLNFSAGA
jgi:hypothetical protein